MIVRILLAGVIMTLCVVSNAFCAPPEPIDNSEKLGVRKVIAVIPFKANHEKLSKKESERLDLVVKSLKKCGKNEVIRVEGFASAGDTESARTAIAMNRARSVWNYLRLRHNIANRLYLTGSQESQTSPSQQQARVEIAIYSDPFLDKVVLNSLTEEKDE